MNREEWENKLLEAWSDVNSMQTYFENVHFHEEEGTSADEALAYANMVEEEVDGFGYILAEIKEKI